MLVRSVVDGFVAEVLGPIVGLVATVEFDGNGGPFPGGRPIVPVVIVGEGAAFLVEEAEGDIDFLALAYGEVGDGMTSTVFGSLFDLRHV